MKGWNHGERGEAIPIDVPLDRAEAGQFDALLLPGGVINADYLRVNPKAVSFAKAFFHARKPIAVICHGSWILIDADIVRGIHMTSYPSFQTDLKNAGALWVDQEVVAD